MPIVFSSLQNEKNIGLIHGSKAFSFTFQDHLLYGLVPPHRHDCSLRILCENNLNFHGL